MWFLTPNKEVREEVCGGTFLNWPDSVYGGVKEVTLVFCARVVLVQLVTQVAGTPRNFDRRIQATAKAWYKQCGRGGQKRGEVGKGWLWWGWGGADLTAAPGDTSTDTPDKSGRAVCWFLLTKTNEQTKAWKSISLQTRRGGHLRA